MHFMKRLYLLRHADSGLAKSGQDDFDRTLTEYGRHAARQIGQYMLQQEYLPAIAYCSPARRTRETWSIIRDALKADPDERFPSGLYLPETQFMLDTVRATENTYQNAVMVSHNPGILALALGLADEDIRAANPYGEYPAAALTAFDFPVASWAALAPAGGTLKEFVRAEEVPSAG